MLIQEDITESHRAQEMLKRHNAYLSALHQTTLGLIGRRELTDLLEALIQRAAQLPDTTDGLFYLADPTATDTEETEIQALNVGADDWIQKPIHKARLLARIKRLLKSKHS